MEAAMDITCGNCAVTVEETDDDQQTRHRCSVTGQYVALDAPCGLEAGVAWILAQFFSTVAVCAGTGCGKQPKQVMGSCWNCEQHVPEPEMLEHDGDLYCQDCYRELRDKPKELGTCWDCGRTFPADSMHPDGDTLECEDCYRRAHQPAPEPPPPAPTAARCQRCEAPVDGRLIMSGVGTVCEPCADAIRQEWEAEQYPAPEPEPEFTCDRVAVPIVADGVTRETALGSATIDACKAYLRYLGLGEAEVNVLPVFIAGYCARGAAK
jgi:hypothetical protein